MEKFELNPAKLCGVARHGALSMTGSINGFTKKFLTAVGAQNSCKPLHYSPKEFVHQSAGFCRSHEKRCPVI